MSPYCPGCLDVWFTEPDRFLRRDWGTIKPGIFLHVSCGRALEKIRKEPRGSDWREVLQGTSRAKGSLPRPTLL